jgi:hypothetical protein
LAGLEDRSSRPHTTPTRTPPQVEARVLRCRAELRQGAVYLAGELGLVASTVARILACHQVPPLTAVDAIIAMPVRPPTAVGQNPDRTSEDHEHTGGQKWALTSADAGRA